MTNALPEFEWPVWLAREDVNLDAKVWQLAQYVSSQGKLPEGCDFLWSETSRLAGLGRGATAMLPLLIQRLDARQLAHLLRGAPEVHLRPLFAGLVVVASSETALIPVLSKFVGALEEDQLISLVRNLGRLSGLYPTGEGELGRRLFAMLQEMPLAPERFWRRLVALRAAARFLPQDHERVGAWRQFQDAFEACLAAVRTRPGTRVTGEAEAGVCELGAALARAMPTDWYPDDSQASGKHRLLNALLAQSAISAAELPGNFAELLAAGLANRPRDLEGCLRLWDAAEETPLADAGVVKLFAGGPRSVPATVENPPEDADAAVLTADSSQGQPAPPDDRLLFQFLDGPAGAGPDVSNSPPLPARWRAMPAEDRRRWLCRALTAYLQTCSRQRAALVLLVEPEISLLLAYGIARLLPAPWRSRLRCGAAGADVAGGPAAGEPRQGAEVVFDTWAAPEASLPALEGFAELIWDEGLLLPGQTDAARRGAGIDQWLQPWEQARVEGLAPLQELALGEVAVRRMLAGSYDGSQTAWMKSPRGRGHVRRRIRQLLASRPNPALLDSAAKSPALLRVVVEAGLEGEGDLGCRAAIRSLVERVESLESLDESLGPGPAGRAFKLHALRHHISTRRRLPGECGWLWRERPSAGQAGQQPLLFDVLGLSSVTGDVIRASLDEVPPEGLGLLFCGVLTTQAEGPAKQDLLARIAARPDLGLPQLLAEFGTDLLIHKEDAWEVLAARVRQMLDQLHADPQRFPSLVAVLETAKRLCQGGREQDQDLVPRIKAWQDLPAVLHSQRERLTQPAMRLLTKCGIRPPSDLRFAEEICRCLDRAYPQATHQAMRSREVAALAEFVMAVAREAGLADQMPNGFPKLLSRYFRRGNQGLQELHEHHKTQTIRLILKQPAVIAAACGALVLLAVVGVLVGRGCGGPSPEPLADRISPASGAVETAGAVGPAATDSPVPPWPTRDRSAPTEAADRPAADVEPPAKEPAEETNPPSPAGDSATATAAGKAAIVLARPPLHDIADATGGKSVELYRGPIGKESTFHLHGTQLLLTLPFADASGSLADSGGGTGQPPLGQARRVEVTPAAGQFTVGVQFARGERPVTLASFRRAPGDAGVLGSLAHMPPTPDGSTARLQELLRYCVLELRPADGSPPLLLALTQPDRDALHLDSTGAAVVHNAQGAPARRLPNRSSGDELYLGAGQLTCPSGEKPEFGVTWTQDAPTQKWSTPDVARAFGFDSGGVELASNGGLTVLTLRLQPGQFEIMQQLDRERRPLNAKRSRVAKMNPADEELSQLLGIDFVYPPGPKPVLEPATDMAGQERNRQQQQEWNELRRQYSRWLNSALLPQKAKSLDELDGQIAEINARYRERLAKAAAYKAWLASSPAVRATIYRLVRYESAERPGWIRVLVVQPADP